MEAQEVFNKVVLHLYMQGEPAFGPTEGCCYRGINGSSCAVGCLIPDDKYDPIIEGVDILQVIEGQNPLYITKSSARLTTILKELSLLDHLELLQDLQVVHDIWGLDPGLNTGEFKGEVVKLLKVVAKDHDLTFPKLPPKE